VHADPEKGASIAVAEAARNIVCSGGKPMAITNCLNFGNPYNPEVYWQFVGAIKGMGAACRAFDTPVTGGNVSFYNHTVVSGKQAIPVFPTPTIGMLGLMEDKNRHTGLSFKNAGDQIFLIGNSSDDINSSEYLYAYHDVKLSPAPAFDLDEEMVMHTAVSGLIANELIVSAHDVSDGGLFVSLAESGFLNNKGFTIQTDDQFRKDGFLFGEAQGRVVVSVSPDKLEAFNEFMALSDANFTLLGEVTSSEILVDDESFGTIGDFLQAYEGTLPAYMNHGK
jgi:phosphoribosylformylglycinamidine synthase